MTSPIFFAGAGELAALDVGSVFVLGGAEGRHASTVKRLAAGERIHLVDGAGRRVTAVVRSAGAGELTVLVDGVSVEPGPLLRLVLVQALAKGDRDELAIEAATELGADGFVPWQAERSIVRWKGERAAKSLAKWRAIVAAAAKQARRAWIPDVTEAVETTALLPRIQAAALALVLHEDARQPLTDALAQWCAQDLAAEDLAAQDLAAEDLSRRETAGHQLAALEPGSPRQIREILILVGPEGGISPRELDLLTGAGAVPVRLGPHVLRSSTAGPAAVALLSVDLHRW
ncbi:16S rRNA (uracil(1498)-N(3))-methyltransferase [Paeniglutamicibacter antarcticus]|uniref:Ribosomal RNA small subunit methyltransferase E n=1 Tax=Arthrobacter terrae TaxID=2935737 RepID=A0A931G5R7_9MICC|nr:16S rRNA (uracil(1498)-N(3))-methyltransferase [Arthrobacter terrae]MBG0740233.1 16S rRNA (uracil(1498)-N(3))-methyltransferase [Arthrobacter terrae]